MDGPMTTLTIKNLPDDLHQRLKERAERHRRSLNSEVLVCLEHAVGASRVDPEAHLARIRAIRAKTAAWPLTDERLEQARREGRP